MTQTVQQTDSPTDVVQRFYAAYGSFDTDGMRAVLADDVAWTIPGHHPLAGEHHGPDAVAAYFQQLARVGFQADPIVLASGDDWVVDLHRGWTDNGNGPNVDMTWALAYRVADGRIAEVLNFAIDQHAADVFFWQVWNTQLLPVPERLQDDAVRAGRQAAEQAARQGG